MGNEGIWKNRSAKAAREEWEEHREWSPETAPDGHKGAEGEWDPQWG